MLAEKAEKADSFWTRARGLLGRKHLEPGQGMWIVPCSMIHTCFMAFEIDALFLDRELRVLRIAQSLKPWRISPWVIGAHSVLELPAGYCQGKVEAGDRLEVQK